MTYAMKPLSCDPARIKGMSERLIISHYENNYGGAVKRLNLIGEKLAELDYANAPGFLINGLKREELVAMNSMILHEHFFDSLGEPSEPDAALQQVLTRDFGSFERWRSEFIAMGKALGGGTANSSINGPPTIAIPWLAAHRSSHSICTSIPITSTLAPKLPTTSASSWRPSTGQPCDAPMTASGHEPPNATNPCAGNAVACDDLWTDRTRTGHVQIARRKGNPRQGRRQGHYR